LLFGAGCVIHACNHAWDTYDPRFTASGTAGSAGASSGGDVDGSPCTPSSSRPCYSGPPATRKVGACKDGFQTCDDTRTWGACTGDVTPTVEDCTTAEDDDCDGVANDHCGVWSLAFGTSGANTGNEAYGMAVSPAGHVVIVGRAHGSLVAEDGDAGTPLGSGGDGVFMVGIDDPTAASAARFGGIYSPATTVALDADGGALLTGGIYEGDTVTFPGSAPLKNVQYGQDFEMFLARIEGPTTAWAESIITLPKGNSVESQAVAWSGAAAYVAGAFNGTSDLGIDGGSFYSKHLTQMVLKIDASSGTTTWQTSIGGSGGAHAVAVSAASGLVIVGGEYYDAPLSIAGKTFPGTGLPAGLVIALADATGDPLRARAYPSPGAQTASARVDSVAVDEGAGDVIVTGRFGGTVDFGGAATDFTSDAGAPDAGAPDAGSGCGPVTAVGPADLFVARLALADFSCRWVKTFGGNAGFNGPSHTAAGFDLRGQDFGPQIAVDSSGDAFLVANFAGTLDVEGWTLAAPGMYTLLLLKLDRSGQLTWLRRFGDADAYATAIGLDDAANVYLAGQFSGTLQIEPSHALAWPAAAQHDGMFAAKVAH
jgi:hypothetical protein